MSLEIVALVAVVAASIGAAFSVWNNTPDSPTPIPRNKLLKSIASAALSAVALVNLTGLVVPDGSTLTWVGFIIANLFIGAGVTKAFNHS
jgi:hypothetical protein